MKCVYWAGGRGVRVPADQSGLKHEEEDMKVGI